MNIKKLDHLVITTADIHACLHFYCDVLNMRSEYKNHRYALYFGDEKFNIHTKMAEFLPAAKNPTYGSLDLCLEVDGNIAEVKKEVEEKGYPIELGPVIKYGAKGEMNSLYLRDPDGNLVELCSYSK